MIINQSLDEQSRQQSENMDYTAVQNVRMLTGDEVAHVFHVHKNQVRIWRDMGILKGTRTGLSIMYSQQEIKEFQERFKGYDISNKIHIMEALEKMKEKEATI